MDFRTNDAKFEILGPNLLNYYHRPVDSIYHKGDIVSDTEEENDFIILKENKDIENDNSVKFLNKSTQTDYRETESQTDPWDPPFKVTKINKDPEVLSLKHLTYGNGLPPTMLEIKYILETIKNKTTIDNSKGGGDTLNENKINLYSQIKADWNYKIAVETENQLKKLELMKSSIIDELNKKSDKKEQRLKSMWSRKKKEIYKQTKKLQEKLDKAKKNIESQFLGEINNVDNEKLQMKQGTSVTSKTKRIVSENNVDYVLNEYFLSNPEELTSVKDWLENKQSVLQNKVPLARLSRRSQQEQLAEEAYQDILFKKRTKLPPKVYHEDYEKEEIILPDAKPEDITEYLDIEEHKIDMVTAWQQILRGLAYQKQMLKLIEKHKDGLSIALADVIVD